MKRLGLMLAGIGLLLVVNAAAEARTWTSSDGHFTLDAEMVEFVDGQVTLKKADGTTITVPISRLSAADRRYAVAERKKPKPPPKPAEPGYVSDIQPFMVTYCNACHNQNKAEHGYATDTYAGLTRTGKKGAVVVPSKPDESLLVRLFQPGHKHMPPDKSPQPTTEQMAKVSAWITAGAVDDTAAPAESKTRPEKPRPRR
jgi:hypothetical protein